MGRITLIIESSILCCSNDSPRFVKLNLCKYKKHEESGVIPKINYNRISGLQ